MYLNTVVSLWEGAGLFAYPLLVCSLLTFFIIIERLIALRSKYIMPEELVSSFIQGDCLSKIPNSVLNQSACGRIIHFFKDNKPDAEALKAYAQLEITALEKGLFILEAIATIAPLLGLLGTLTALVQIFSNMSDFLTGIPNTHLLAKGISLALTTTIGGLGVAIPTIAGYHLLIRRIDILCSKINIGVERLINLIPTLDK